MVSYSGNQVSFLKLFLQIIDRCSELCVRITPVVANGASKSISLP